VPGCVDIDVLKFTVSGVDELVFGFGVIVTCAPVGPDVEVKVTAPVKPPDRVTFTVYDTVSPMKTDFEAAGELSAKSGFGVTAETAPAIPETEASTTTARSILLTNVVRIYDSRT